MSKNGSPPRGVLMGEVTVMDSIEGGRRGRVASALCTLGIRRQETVRVYVNTDRARDCTAENGQPLVSSHCCISYNSSPQ